MTAGAGGQPLPDDGSRPIADDPDHHRLLYVHEGEEAELVYRRHGRRLVIVHTGVPDPLAGQGIGGKLVRAAVDWARHDGLTIVPWCPYARHWLEEHDDDTEDVQIDWRTLPSR